MKQKKISHAQRKKRRQKTKPDRRPRRKTNQKAPNELNVGKLMRRYSNGMNISPSAVTAMIHRLDLFLELAMPHIATIARTSGCNKTIKEHEDLTHPEKSQAHVTWFFSLASNKVETLADLKKPYHWELVRHNKKQFQKKLKKPSRRMKQ